MVKLKPAYAVIACLFLSTPAFASEGGDSEAGKDVYKKCATCHQIGDGAKNRVGPHLDGVVGRVAGSLDDYKRYSKGIIAAGQDGLVWDNDALDSYLEDPKSFISGTRMSFRGVKDAQERKDLIAYLTLFSTDAETSAIEVEAGFTVSADILAIQGDYDYGEYLSSECLACHQLNGNDAGIPSISGWPQEDFVTAMHAYKQKHRSNPVMQMMAGRLSNEEIAGLAEYFNSVE